MTNRTRNALIKTTAVLALIIVFGSFYLLHTEYWKPAIGFLIFGAGWLVAWFEANDERILEFLVGEKKKDPSLARHWAQSLYKSSLSHFRRALQWFVS